MYRVTTYLENPQISGNTKDVRKSYGKWESPGKYEYIDIDGHYNIFLILCHLLVPSVATILHNLLLGRISLLCKCSLLLLTVYYALSLCQSVDLSQSLAMQKWLNRSRCHLGCGPKKPCHGVHIPMHAGSFEREKVICMANN